MRKWLVSMLVLAFVLGSVGIGVAAEKVFIFGRGGDSVRLDPADITDGESVKVCNQIFETLVKFKRNSTAVEPCLATEWKVSPDGKVWTFYLRKGVKFHDGTDFDANAVVFSLKRQMDPNHPAHKGDFAYWGYMYTDIKDVKALGKYVVQITLKRPYAPFLSNMACFPVMIVSPTAMMKMGVEKFRIHPVGTGPFKFVEWKKNDRIVLEAFDDYWGGRPKIDKLIFRSIPDNTTRLMALIAGEIDAMDGVSPENIKTLKDLGRKDLKVLAQPGMNVGYLAMNCEKKPFDNVLVRRAINHAINKKKLIKEVYQGIAIPAKNPLPPTLWGYNNEIKDYDYNPKKAKELLKKAGYPNGFETDLWYMPVPRPYCPDGKLVAQAIQQDLEKVGIKCKLVTYDWGTYLEKTENGEHSMALLGWIGDNGDPDNFLYVLLDKDNAVKGSAGNIAFYKSDELHEILIKAQTIFDQKKRAELYKKAQVIIHRDAPWVPLAHAYNLAIINTKVKGFYLHPTGQYWFDTIDIEQ